MTVAAGSLSTPPGSGFGEVVDRTPAHRKGRDAVVPRAIGCWARAAATGAGRAARERGVRELAVIFWAVFLAVELALIAAPLLWPEMPPRMAGTMHIAAMVLVLVPVIAWLRGGGRAARSRGVEDHPDVLLRQAIHYIPDRTWREERQSWRASTNRLAVFRSVLAEVRRMARDGRLQVWGRRTETEPREPIPSGHWRDYRISIVSVMDDRDRNACRSEPAELHASSQEVYYDLETSRLRVEEIWPARRWWRS